MATKNNPGNFDCYKNAEPDEPMFVLLGRDPTASIVVAFWIAIREELAAEGDEDKIEEAKRVATQLVAWAEMKGKRQKTLLAAKASVSVILAAKENAFGMNLLNTAIDQAVR